MVNFSQELESLINRYSKENESNTPDFILAKYLESCLAAFNAVTNARTGWYKPDSMKQAMYSIMQQRRKGTQLKSRQQNYQTILKRSNEIKAGINVE